MAIGGEQTPPKPTTGLIVTFDGVKQNWNDTTQQVLTWGSVAPSMSYTKNITVVNLNPSAVTLILYTTEPQGATQTWPKNNTLLSANYTTSGHLTLTTSSTLSNGEYSWLLIASNSTTQNTPTPNPTGTAQARNCTIKTNMAGVASIKVDYINKPGNGITVYPSMMTNEGYILPFASGDTLKFTTTPMASYDFNGYTFNDGTAPYNLPEFTCTATQNFTITANVNPTVN